MEQYFTYMFYKEIIGIVFVVVLIAIIGIPILIDKIKDWFR